MKESVGVGARSLHGAKMRYSQRPAGDQHRLSLDTRYFIRESNTTHLVRSASKSKEYVHKPRPHTYVVCPSVYFQGLNGPDLEIKGPRQIHFT